MLYLLHNICLLKQERIRTPKVPTTIIQDAFIKNPNMRNILIQVEPEAIRQCQNQIIQNAHHFDYILTFNDTILKSCTNAYKYIFGMCRIIPEDYLNININAKKFLITSVTNDKHTTVGHNFRHTIYYNQLNITTIPTRFYISNDAKTIPSIQNNPILGSQDKDKMELFKDSQFSLVIENSRQIHYFTEKLCDCLITKTIPVYYGCPNISDYFDTTGWILLEDESLDTFMNKVETLTEDYYMKYLPVIEKNYNLVKQYIDLHENINRVLVQIPEY